MTPTPTTKAPGFARGVSLALALITTAVLTVAPFVLAPRMDGAAHGLLSLLLLGVCGAFVHGFGFRPEHRILRLLCSPAVIWPLMAGTTVALMLRR